MNDLLFYTPEGVFGIFPKDACPPGVPETFKDQEEAEARLREFTKTPALRQTLYLNYLRYVGPAPVNIPDEQMIRALAKKLVSGELALMQLSGAKAPGKDAKEQPQAVSKAKEYKPKPEPQINGAAVAAEVKKETDEKAYKIAIEVAGAGLTDCCYDRLVSAAVVNGHTCVNPRRMTAMANARNDDHRHEVELKGITRDSRAIFINPGCNEANDAVCPIPLHTRVRPVDESAASDRWPTTLVPIVPLVFTDADNTVDQAMPLGNGWLYIYIDGHLWRELQG